MTNYKDSYKGRTVLVTGGAGAIGSNLTRTLAGLGAQVIILDDLSSAAVPDDPPLLLVGPRDAFRQDRLHRRRL
ncbi:MAG: NAD-dependent epimerase/dehydratase family protein, partial [Candidatus Aminicenantales bacterium]